MTYRLNQLVFLSEGQLKKYQTNQAVKVESNTYLFGWVRNGKNQIIIKEIAR